MTGVALRRELEGKDEECKHGSHQRRDYFLSDLLLFFALLHIKQMLKMNYLCVKCESNVLLEYVKNVHE